MKVVIIEDEHHAQKRLNTIIQALRPGTEIIETIDSVEDAIAFLSKEPAIDLIFLDIQLSDGLSFDIFKEIKIEVPVIFTTAFDEYAIKAFKLNSIDYLLKPVEEEELEKALRKFEKIFNTETTAVNSNMQALIHQLSPKTYQSRFLIKSGQQLHFINIDDIAYFYSESSLSFIKTKDKKKHIVEYTMDQIEELIDPNLFYRVNRKTIVQVNTIEKAVAYFNSRLVLKLSPPADFEVIVSREKVKSFKIWLGGSWCGKTKYIFKFEYLILKLCNGQHHKK